VNFYSYRNIAHVLAHFKDVKFMKVVIRSLHCEVICGCKPYIPQYVLDYEPPRALLISSEDYGVPSSTIARDLVSCNFFMRPI